MCANRFYGCYNLTYLAHRHTYLTLATYNTEPPQLVVNVVWLVKTLIDLRTLFQLNRLSRGAACNSVSVILKVCPSVSKYQDFL